MNELPHCTIIDNLISSFIECDLFYPDAKSQLQAIANYQIHMSCHFHRLIHEICKEGKEDCLLFLINKYPDCITLTNCKQEFPILTAIFYEQLDIVKILIKHDSPLDFNNQTKDTLLHHLCSITPSPQKLQLVKTVIKKHQSLVSKQNIFKQTPLFFAALSGDYEVVLYLYEKEGNTIFNNINTTTLLSFAIDGGNGYIIDFIKNKTINSPIPKPETEPERVENWNNSQILKTRTTKFSTLINGFQKYAPIQYTSLNNYPRLSEEGEFKLQIMNMIKESFDVNTKIENSNYCKGNKYRIISLDGGGVRVILQVVILKRLYEKYPSLFKSTQMFCGCSASSFIIGCLAMGYSINPLPTMVQHILTKAFSQSGKLSIFNNKYEPSFLKYFAEMAFSDLPLSEVPKHIAIPSLLIDNGPECPRRCVNSRVFTNVFSNSNSENDNSKEKVADVCLRSAAAPSYFPPYQNYVDGALVDNQPIGVTLPLIIGEEGIVNKEDIVCLSISTGTGPNEYINSKNIGNGGWGNWAMNIANTFLYAGNSRSENICKSLLGKRYKRVNPILKTNIKIDDVGSIEKIKKIGYECDLTDVEKWLNEYW
ncbi:phospholipase A2 [Entamoeba marina]